MTIRQFFNLQEEKIDNDLKVIVDKITNAYSIDEKTYETDKEDVIILIIRYFEVIKTLWKLCLYKKKHKNRDSK